MVSIELPAPAKGFYYSAELQRSPEWIKLGLGKVGGSSLHRWMAVSKRDGKPLKARLDYEREIAFEKAFGVPFSRYVTGAMQEGIDNESYLMQEYTKATNHEVDEVGAFYNDYIRVSPDGLIGKDGGLELKWLQDASWTEVVASGEPYVGSSGDHFLQCQAGMMASGRKWWDYVAGNPNTGRFIIIRVERDDEIIAGIAESIKAVKDIKPLEAPNIYEFSTSAPITEDNPWG